MTQKISYIGQEGPSGDEPCFIAQLMDHEHKSLALLRPTKDPATATENARRLAACWNACEGIPTDDLEMCPEGGLYHLADHANQLAIQSDELLAALQEINSWLVCACIATPEDMAQSFGYMQQVAQGAIDKAGGATTQPAPDDNLATPEEIDRARAEYSSEAIDIDDGAAVSRSDEGVWVAAWVWLADDEGGAI